MYETHLHTHAHSYDAKNDQMRIQSNTQLSNFITYVIDLPH